MARKKFLMENIVTTLLSELWNVWKAMFSAFMDVLPKVLSVGFWVLLAVIVLPCVFVASNIYPWWVEFGEDF